MTRLKIIGISIILVIINCLFSYYLRAWSIFITPITIGVLTFLYQKAKINVFLIASLVIILLISDDISLKFSTTDNYDLEGMAVANLCFLISIIMSLIITFPILFVNAKWKIFKFLLFYILIFFASFIYNSYFYSFGLITYSSTSKSKEIAIRNKVFLNNLKFSTNHIIYKNDTINIIDGWAEKQVIINHKNFIKKYDSTSTINYKIKLESKINFDSIKFRYNINDADVRDSYRIDSLLGDNILSSIHKITLYIFTENHNIKTDTLIEKISITR